MGKINEQICESLLLAFRANPAFAGCDFLAFTSFGSGPDISTFFEDMEMYSENVCYPKMTAESLNFSGADERKEAVLFLPEEAFLSEGELFECYKAYISSHKNIIRKVGICAKKSLAGGKAPDCAREVVDIMFTEDGPTQL